MSDPVEDVNALMERWERLGIIKRWTCEECADYVPYKPFEMTEKGSRRRHNRTFHPKSDRDRLAAEKRAFRGTDYTPPPEMVERVARAIYENPRIGAPRHVAPWGTIDSNPVMEVVHEGYLSQASAVLKALEPELREVETLRRVNAELERVNADQRQILSAFSKEIDAEELAKGLRARDELWKPRRRP